ncbi:MAG: hypothetical protein WEA58_08970 [Balneolaceae bacterium]
MEYNSSKSLILKLSLIITFVSCSSTHDQPGPNLVEVIASEYKFEAPNEIPSGWTQFQMSNHGEEEHFLLITPLAEGVTIEDLQEGGRFLQELHNKYDNDEIKKDEIYEILNKAFGPPTTDINYNGGPGFLSMGHTVEATTFLDPGRYAIECYIRTPQGIQHNVIGMIQELVVTEEKSEATQPSSDHTIVLDNEGIKAEDNLDTGTYTFEVEFREHPSGYIGNDVHLVRVDEEVTMERIAEWMDVFEKDGLVSPAPVEFLGGTQERPKGKVAYFTVKLEPGEYAWVAELDYDDKKWKRFTVH